MASQAVPLQPPVRRGWTSTPHSYFKSLPRRLSPVAHQILGIILDDTIGAWPRREWMAAKHSYFAFFANCTVDRAQKALGNLRELELVERRRTPAGFEYRAVLENFETPPERSPRHFGPEALEKLRARRKSPTVAIEPHFNRQSAAATVDPGEAEDYNPPMDSSQPHTIKLVEKAVDAVESPEHHPAVGSEAQPVSCPNCGVSLGRTKGVSDFAVSSPSDGANKPDSEKQSCFEAGLDGPVSPAEQLETFCLETITPRLGSAPAKKLVARWVQTLGAAPVAMLEARITQRLPLFEGPKASWGAVELLAEDVAKTHHALKKLRGRAPVVELSEHWRSSAEIRRLHGSKETPEHIQKEILQMWPELKASDQEPESFFDKYLREKYKHK